MKVLYTCPLNCKARCAKCVQHALDYAFQIIEIDLTMFAPIVACNLSGHGEGQGLPLSRAPAGAGGLKHASKLKEPQVTRVVVKVALDRLEQARQQRRAHLVLVDIDRIGQDDSVSAAGRKSPVEGGVNEA